MAPPTNDAVCVVLLDSCAGLHDQIFVPELDKYGFAVTAVATTTALYDCLRVKAPHIVVLDIGPPNADHFSVVLAVRTLLPHIGLVLLSSSSDLEYQLRGLTLGADAYLVKPTPLELLAATLRSLVRRLRGRPGTMPGHWHFDAEQGCLISPSGVAVALSNTERRMISRLAAAPGQLVSREQLVAAVADDVHDYDPHRIESLIHRLRRKVANQCGERLPLRAVHGRGYVLCTR